MKSHEIQQVRVVKSLRVSLLAVGCAVCCPPAYTLTATCRHTFNQAAHTRIRFHYQFSLCQFFLDLMALKDIVNSSALLARLVMVLNQTLHAASTNNIQESHIKANYSMCLKHAYCKPQVSQQSAFFNYCTYCNFSYSTGVLITFPA